MFRVLFYLAVDLYKSYCSYFPARQLISLYIHRYLPSHGPAPKLRVLTKTGRHGCLQKFQNCETQCAFLKLESSLHNKLPNILVFL